MRPGEQITLKLRPRGASGGDFATFSLRVADADLLADNDRQIQAMGADSTAITRFLEQLKPQQAGLAAAVLAQPEIRLQLGEIMQCWQLVAGTGSVYRRLTMHVSSHCT